MAFEISVFGTTTIAMCVFFVGYALVKRFAVLRDYAIPEPIIGGFAFAILVATIYWLLGIEIAFDLFRRDLLLVYFFAALGMGTNIREVVSFGRPLFVLVALAAVFIVIQNGAGIAIAEAFGHDPRNGIVAGSMALIGRSGTTVAWAPILQAQFEMDHVSRLGLGINMLGLVAACCIGGPLARLLIARYHVSVPGPSANLDVGTSKEAEPSRIDHHAFLLALLRLHIAIVIGAALQAGLQVVGVQAPLYVTCLVAAIALGNAKSRLLRGFDWSASDAALSLIAYVSLGLFYTMTVMSLQFWTVGAFLSFSVINIVIQSVLATVFACAVVFRAFGRSYDAVVLSAGFVGIALGSTATTLAIMTAIAMQYGRAHKPFVMVPLACGIFIDLINSVMIGLFLRLL